MKTMEYKGNFIDGEFVLPQGRIDRILSEDPGNLSHPVGEFWVSLEAVRLAVDVAQEAFPKWARRTLKERASFILRFKRVLKARASDLALLISREMGKMVSESRIEIDRLGGKVDQAIHEELKLVESDTHEISRGVVGRLRFRPRGVVAVLSPFNLPAYLGSAQVISALLFGNTVVFKPSELTPFVGQFLASIWKEAGLPRGVFNLVHGGAMVGEALVNHPQVDAVIFTGSWSTGSRIQEQLLNQPHKVCALEMGGKNCAIVLRDADLRCALEETITGAFLTTGQRCNATSRIAVEKPIADQFIDRFLERVDQIKIGYGQNPDAWMGPLVSQKARDKVLSYLELARHEGFQVLREGGEFHADKKGYYLKPSVHFRRGFPELFYHDGSYTDDEIFGPDVAIYEVKNLEEAIRLNNASRYGLVSSVFTKSRPKFEQVLKEAETGLVHWNVGTTRSSGRLPFGGLKRSGNARPAGFFSPYLSTFPIASVERPHPR
ncbi:MAG: aldehyde dehydrogenase family protein [Candidatus Omnitrophica bacterium]|nr:aldehyde dehydrogenase family protein [Candidatus Omnitrophota bacterium]